jgi:hypothetical protein
MITPAQQRILEMPFPLSAHGIVPGVNEPYIRKDAIKLRLSAVDPAWTLGRPSFEHESANVVLYVGSLTVRGVTRWGMGAGIIQQLEQRVDKQTGALLDPKPFEIDRMISNAHKKAEVDVLPRAAIEFGVGAYLKRKPKNVKSLETLADFLDGLTPHWALNGGGNRINALMKSLGLKWDDVAEQIEPGRTLPRLSETWLTMAQFEERLYVLAEEKKLTEEIPAA